MKALKIISTLISILVFASLGFGTWGLYTESGHREFREAAAVVPLLSLQLGYILFVVLLFLSAVIYFLKRKAKKRT